MIVDDDTVDDLPDAFGHTIFCDDIRHEIDGKTTYVGVYKGVMYVHGELPITVPKLCFAVSVTQKRANFDPHVTVIVEGPGETDIVKVETNEISPGALLAGVDATFPWKSPLVSLEATVIAVGLKIAAEGIIKVRAEIGDKKVRVGRLRVIPQPLVRPA